jgi:ketopantoate reductase
MKLAIIGSGRMGSAFATAFATRTSHAVAVRGSHAKSGSAAELVRELGITRADDKALLSTDVVFVAVPPAALSEVAADLKDYTGVVVSVIVPGAGGMTLAQEGASAAEQLAELLPKERGYGVHLDFFRADPHAELGRQADPFSPVPTRRTRGRRISVRRCRAPRHDRLSPRLWRGPRQSRCAAGLRRAGAR